MKKLLSLVIVTGLLTMALAGVAVANPDDSDSSALPPIPHYFSVTGTVVSIDPFEGQEDWQRVSIEDADGNPATLIVTEDTVYPFESEIKVGDTVTGYYLSEAPMVMIWPPQYTTAILVAGIPGDSSVRADRFYAWDDHTDDYLINTDKSFAFLIDGNTEIILANGDDFSDGDIEGRRLVVIYSISTRSIPELATATKVIVLYEDAVPLPGEDLTDTDLTDNEIDASGWPIAVDGKQIEAPAAFQTENGFVMVPLRAIAEALGYTVQWSATARSVTLNGTVVIRIGSTSYKPSAVEYKVISGAPAPVLVNSSTYVPLQFFREVLGMPNAFAAEGVIEVHSTGDRME